MSKSARARIAASTVALMLALTLAATSAEAITVTGTVNNRFTRTCDQNGNGCSGWVQVNGSYVSYVGSTCVQTNKMWGWAWTTAVWTWTRPAGWRC